MAWEREQVKLWFYKLPAAGLAAVPELNFKKSRGKTPKFKFEHKTPLNIKKISKSSDTVLQRHGEL